MTVSPLEDCQGHCFCDLGYLYRMPNVHGSPAKFTLAQLSCLCKEIIGKQAAEPAKDLDELLLPDDHPLFMEQMAWDEA